MGVSCSKGRVSCDDPECRGAHLVPDSPRRHSSRRTSVDAQDLSLLRLTTRALALDIDNVSAQDIARLPGDLAQQLLSELVSQRSLDYATLCKFAGQVLYDVNFSYLDDVDDEWVAVLHAAPLVRVALRRCEQVCVNDCTHGSYTFTHPLTYRSPTAASASCSTNFPCSA